MLIIIGGSGMLLEASRSLTLDTTEAVLLCGRRRERYASILQAATHSEFFEFDFSLACDYERLQAYLDMQSAGGQLPDDGADLTFLLWVHSPYDDKVAKMLAALDRRIRRVYLVRGTSSHPICQVWAMSKKIVVIELGRHPSQDRWLWHDEICERVLQRIADDCRQIRPDY